MTAAAGGPGPRRMAVLLQRWQLRVGSGPGALGAGTALLARWSEPHRAYHTAAHLAAVLGRLDRLAAAGTEVTDAVELAAWWHDAVYDVRRADNEARSAELAAAGLASLGWPAATASEVARLVRLTAGHRVEGGDPAGAALCDADLGVLGGAAPAYRAYVSAVRREYGHLDDDAFRHGRIAVLAGLLDRPHLYATTVGRRWWEAAARANVGGELAELRRRPAT